MHPGLSSLKNTIYKTLCLETLSISSTVILITSIVIRFLAMGCIALAIYFLYEESIIGDAELPALNTITLHSMPLGSFIQRLVHSSCMPFPLEFLLGILGIFATLQKKKRILIVYMCLCMIVVVMYVVLIILWGILYDGVDQRVESSFKIFYLRYQHSTYLYNQLKGEYETTWQSYYTNVSCCGSTKKQTCRNVGERPGCYDIFELKMKIYIQTFLCILCIFAVCQVFTIIVSDYNLIKLQLKEQKKRISFQKKSILCLKEYGLLPTFWGFLRLVWKRSPVRLVSVMNKSVNMLCGTTLVIVSICFLNSDFVSNWDLIKYFRQINIYSYNFHDLMAGFGASFLTIGCLSIGNSIVGFIGSNKQTTLLHTLSFFLSCFLIVIKCIAFVFWAVMYDQIISTIGTQLNSVVDTTILVDTRTSPPTDKSVFVNRLMVNFQCCEFDQTIWNLRSFCYSDMDHTIVDFNKNYFNPTYIYDTNTFGIYGEFRGLKKCGSAIEERLRLPSGFFFTFLVIGIVSDILAMILISKEHKERQREKQIQDGVQEKTTGMHLIPWLINIYKKNKPRSTYQLIYIIVTTFMVMLELSFIVLTSIFALSSHVDGDYIKEFRDVYTFLAISGIALASCCMIGRIFGLVGVRYQLRKIIFVDTAAVVVTMLLSLAYFIIASVLRHQEYPCEYQVFFSVIQNCSRRLVSRTGVAIGMFVIEFVMQIIALIIHDRSYQYFLVDTATVRTDEDKIQPGLLKTFYNYLFVDRPIFQHGPKLQRPIAAYSLSCAAVSLLEITFIVLVCFYGVSWHADRSWVHSGLDNISTVDLGDLFDFLSLGSLVLIPIICLNRFVGISAILQSRKVFLYLNSVILYVTFLLTVIFIVLMSFLLSLLYRCEINIINSVETESCPHHRTIIVGTALAVFVVEIIMQVLSFVVNHRSYGYFLSDVGEPPEQTEIQNSRRGMFTYLYDHVFKRRKPFRNAAKFTVVVAIYVISSLVMLMIEVTFIVLVSIYGLSWLIDRSWVQDVLYRVDEGSLDIGITFDFLAIALLPLITIIVLNRFLGIGSVFKRWKKVLYLNFVVLFFTTVLTVLFLVLSSIVLGLKYRCKFYDYSVYDYKDCPPRMNTIVGVAIAMLILELFIQIYSFFVIDRSYQYCQSESDEDDDNLTKTDIQKGMIISLYDKMFLRRKPFRDAAKFTVVVAVYVLSTIVMFMIEVTFIVLVSVYGLSWVIYRSWVQDILYRVNEGSLNIGIAFDFLAIALIPLIIIIVLNRFLGIGSVFKRWNKVLYLNFVVLFFTTVLTVLFLVLSSIVLGLKYRCKYFDVTVNDYKDCPPRMNIIVGGAIAMLILELFMEIYSFFVIDRSYQYCQTGSDEEDDISSKTDIQKGMLISLYDKMFLRRKPFRDAAKFTVVVAVYVISTIVMLMIEVTFIVLVSIYGLSWVIDRSWVQDVLYRVNEGSLNIGVTFDFLAIALSPLITIIVLNRFLGIGSVLKRWKKVLYLNFVVLFFTTVLTVLCLVLFSIVLGLKYRCKYFDSTVNDYKDCPPRMNTIVGVAITMLIVELLMQIFSIFVIDRSHQYCQNGSGEDDKSLTETTKQKRMFVTMYEGIFRRREPFIDSHKLEVFIGIHVIAAIMLLIIEVCFIVLVSIYGLSWVMDRYWITLGLDALNNSSMNLRRLFDFLAICSLVLIPVISMNRFLGIYAVSTKRTYILYINSAIMIITILMNVICLILASILLFAEYRCTYNSPTTNIDGTCREMNATVGVGIAMLAVELVMQIALFVVNDRSYRHFKEDTGDESNSDGLFQFVIRKYILKRKLLVEFSQLTIPTLLICIGSTIWLVVEILFWVGTIIEIGSPRFINGTLMNILYRKSFDHINLGHLLDGLGYTAIGSVPVIVFVRLAGVYVMLERKPTMLITPAITSVLFCLGCATLFGLSTYHIQYVYNCLGSSIPECDSTMMDILMSVAAVYLTFFIVEFTIHILQSCLFFYAIKIMIKFSVKELHLIQTPEKSKRILRYFNIGIRIFEMVIAFMMMLSITFWLSDGHVNQATYSFSSESFYGSNLLRLAEGLVSFSLVTITIVIVNNIVSIVAIINGSFRILKVNTVIVGICILSEVVSLGLQAEIEDRLYDRAISVYISFTVIQIVCQIIYVVLSVLDIKGVAQTNKVNDSQPSSITNTTTSIIATSKSRVETITNSGDDIEHIQA